MGYPHAVRNDMIAVAARRTPVHHLFLVLRLLLVELLLDRLRALETARSRTSLVLLCLAELGEEVRDVVRGEDGRVRRGLLVLLPVALLASWAAIEGLHRLDPRVRAGNIYTCLQPLHLQYIPGLASTREHASQRL